MTMTALMDARQQLLGVREGLPKQLEGTRRTSVPYHLEAMPPLCSVQFPRSHKRGILPTVSLSSLIQLIEKMGMPSFIHPFYEFPELNPLVFCGFQRHALPANQVITRVPNEDRFRSNQRNLLPINHSMP